MELILKDQGAGNGISHPLATIPESKPILAKGLSNSAYASLVADLAPITITRDQATLIHALLAHRPLSINDEIQRQDALKSLINSLA